MTGSSDWLRLDALLEAALSRPPRERRRFLDEACQQDARLRARLEELLDLAEAEDPDLKPGGGLEGRLAREVLDDLAGETGEATLPPGSRLGRFEIADFLGAGSVGRVYRARDLTLGREVAIKALAEAFRSETAALRRFEREARVLATLSHPNVAGIYGLEVIDGAPYLILELVEGETLEERLRRGPLSLSDAVEVGRQIAAALEEAHGKGIVHRDLKPSNVKLAGPGQVKVLDFGLARTVPPPQGGTLTSGPATVTTTGPGILQGTAPYMSPEQARGLPLDTRSDIWAFGCVLYEMLAGRRVFEGRAVADVLAAVVRDEVDWTALPDGLPPPLRLLLERCLRRDARQRLQDIGDARLELSELRLDGSRARAPAGPSRAGQVIRRAAPGLILAAGLAGLWFAREWRGAARPASGRVHQSTLSTPPGIELSWDVSAAFALAPDASNVVFRGSHGAHWQLYVRPLDRLEARPLPGTERGLQPVFSPDGRWVAFLADGNLKKVALAGGPPILLVRALPVKPRGASWGPDGTIVLAGSATSGLSRVSAEGGPVQELTRPDFSRGERSHGWPHVLPGGQTALFTVRHWGTDFEEAAIEAVSLDTGARKALIQGAHPLFLPPRHLIFVRSARLFAVGFDPERLEVEGTPTPVLEGVRFGAASGGTHIALAHDGTLVYVPGGPPARERHLAWLGVDGHRTRLPGPPRLMDELRLSPSGDRVALRIGPRDQGEVWIQHLGSRTLSQLTFDLRPRFPIWTRDGRKLTVSSEGGGRWRLLSVPISGGPPQVLHERPFLLRANDWSPDGRFLAFQELDPVRGWDLAVLEVDGKDRVLGSPRPLAITPAHEMWARFSPDGRWLAYEWDESGTVGICVAPFGRPGVPVKAAAEGYWPIWGERRELFYWLGAPNRIRRIAWRETGGDLHVLTDVDIWPIPLAGEPRLPLPTYDFDRKARRFLFFEPPPEAAPSPPYQMALFVGWGDDVKRRLAAR